MQIEVDNPMAILTQDTSRSFLANSSSSDKYKFFLKGTMLEKLIEYYKEIDVQIDLQYTVTFAINLRPLKERRN
jgi:hypothetical protein